MNNRSKDNFTLQNFIDEGDKHYEESDYDEAVNHYKRAIEMISNDSQAIKENHLLYFKLGSCYLQMANDLIDTDKDSAAKNALEASALFEMALYLNSAVSHYYYYAGRAKAMAVSEGLNHVDDYKLLSSVLYFYKKAKNLGFELEDVDQEIKLIQDKLDSILEVINKDHVENNKKVNDKSSEEKKSVTFSRDTIFNDNKNSSKNLKRKSESNDESPSKKNKL